VTYAPSQHEQVPDGMVEFQFAPQVENSPQRVEQPSHPQENQAGGVEVRQQWFGHDHHDPPHGQVQHRGQHRKAVRPKSFAHYARRRYAPHYAEHRPTQPAVQGYQRDRGVGPGYQQKYGRVVEYPEQLLGPPGVKTVVQGR